MNFDRTFIAIRERTTAEILDLSLHVLVDHFKSIVTLWGINVVPWILLDFWLIGWMLDSNWQEGTGASFGFSMFLLVMSQSQMGTFLITQYLGKAMFEGRPAVGEVLKAAWSMTPYFWFSQCILRMALFTALACLMFTDDDFETNGFVFFLMILIAGGSWLTRALRPFVTEILILERTPIRAKPKTIHFSARSGSLHSFASGDLFGKAVTVGVFSVVLAFAIHSFLVITDQVMNLRPYLEFSLQPYYWVFSLWVVAGFFAVVRFLFYIDLRIRQEGWAVELRMRAEAQRLEEAIE